MLFKILALPVVAAWPPLATTCVPIPPQLRYFSYEASTFIFFWLLTLSKSPAFRQDRHWPRDYGMTVWIIMHIISQMSFIFVGGPRDFAKSPENLIELIANVGSLTGLVLSH